LFDFIGLQKIALKNEHKKWAYKLSEPKLGHSSFASGYVYVIRTQKRTTPQNGSKKIALKNGHIKKWAYNLSEPKLGHS
jgi:hypothetical protein